MYQVPSSKRTWLSLITRAAASPERISCATSVRASPSLSCAVWAGSGAGGRGGKVTTAITSIAAPTPATINGNGDRNETSGLVSRNRRRREASAPSISAVTIAPTPFGALVPTIRDATQVPTAFAWPRSEAREVRNLGSKREV